MPEDESSNANDTNDSDTNGQSQEFAKPNPAPPENATDADLEELIERVLREHTVEDFDSVTLNGEFRMQTLRLMQGGITVEQWGDSLAEALNIYFDVPLLDEETEGKLFGGAVDVIGGALRGWIRGDTADMEQLSKNSKFRFQTIMLMEGEITVPEWTDVLAKLLDERIDIPWVPDFAEGMIFRKGVEIIGNVLHGYLRGGSKKASDIESIVPEMQSV